MKIFRNITAALLAAAMLFGATGCSTMNKTGKGALIGGGGGAAAGAGIGALTVQRVRRSDTTAVPPRGAANAAPHKRDTPKRLVHTPARRGAGRPVRDLEYHDALRLGALLDRQHDRISFRMEKIGVLPYPP